MEFWDGKQEAFLVTTITHEERATIWDAASSYVHEQLLQHKGVRIPSLGTLDVVHEEIQVGDELVTIHRPTFSLARNLALVHNLMGNKLYAPGNKELEPLKYSKVASSIPTSRQKVERCIQGTMSQLSYCLGKGETVALLLKDIGVLLIEGKRVEVRFYSHFLEELVGKRSLEKARAKVPHLLDMGMSPSSPVASLSTIGRIIVFPAFEMTLGSKQPPKVLLQCLGPTPGEDEERAMGRSPSLDEDMEGGSPGVPIPGIPTPMAGDGQELQEAARRKKATQVRQIPKDSPGRKSSERCPKPKRSQKEVEEAGSDGRGRGGKGGRGREGEGRQERDGRGGRGEGIGGGRGGKGAGRGGRRGLRGRGGRVGIGLGIGPGMGLGIGWGGEAGDEAEALKLLARLPRGPILTPVVAVLEDSAEEEPGPSGEWSLREGRGGEGMGMGWEWTQWDGGNGMGMGTTERR